MKRSPKDKEVKEKDKEPVGPKRSLIAPLDDKVETKTPVPFSGIDAIILLNVENETSFKRAAGRRIDPVTNIEYHLEYNPPPTNIPVSFCFFDSVLENINKKIGN
jgi:hypothetical protein